MVFLLENLTLVRVLPRDVGAGGGVVFHDNSLSGVMFIRVHATRW